jgi:GNAT superfamily N-acetyltransferase
MQQNHDSLPYYISDDKTLLELDTLYALLQTTYWASERSKETIAKSIEGSQCIGVYTATGQVGFMRIVTDGATFSWICDVIVHPDHRGQGLGKWMMQFMVEYPKLRHTNMLLGTRDAHGLYEQYQFQRKEMMIRRRVAPATVVE